MERCERIDIRATEKEKDFLDSLAESLDIEKTELILLGLIAFLILTKKQSNKIDELREEQTKYW